MLFPPSTNVRTHLLVYVRSLRTLFPKHLCLPHTACKLEAPPSLLHVCALLASLPIAYFFFFFNTVRVEKENTSSAWLRSKLETEHLRGAGEFAVSGRA